jgi:hypothetical protein
MAVIEGKSAGGDESVQMKMIFERLVPSVQHGDNANCSPRPETEPKRSRSKQRPLLLANWSEGLPQKRAFHS